MHMALLKNIATSFVFSCVFLLSFAYGKPNLIVRNNGPGLLGGNLTFFAVLRDYSPTTGLVYNFTDGIQHFQVEDKESNISLTAFFSNDLYKDGSYNMSATVSDLNHNLLASNSSVFQLKNDLIGKIIVIRDETNSSQDVDEVAVGENNTICVNLYDPNKNLNWADISYSWSIDYEYLDEVSQNITYNYKRPGYSIISATVSTKLPDGSSKYGIFKKKIGIKIPVNNVNVSGNPFIHHGEMLLMNISCNGSSPFYYCIKFFNANETTENFSCPSTIASTTCNFRIQRYFRKSDDYHVGIYISNDVKVVKRIIQVVVYSVSKKPQLSTVIIPIVCTLMTLIIIAGGVTYCVQQRSQLAIEVANFDFQDDSEAFVERTFFEQIYDSFTCSGCTRNRADRDEEDSIGEEQEPLLSCLPSTGIPT